jgi:hypothetical protein
MINVDSLKFAAMTKQKLMSSIFIISALMLPTIAISASTDSDTFKVSDDKEFSGYREPLVAYLRNRHTTTLARVCILGEQGADGSKWAWVIWPKGRKMILWGGGDSSMISSRRILDLKRDVVASEPEVKGSTYLVTRRWVEQQQARCNQFGTQVEISADELQS